MVKGLGVDIADSDRIANLIEKYKGHFIEKVFTRAEIEYCETKANPSLHFAGRWAAKEAFYKALPLTCQEVSSWKSVEILAEGKKRIPTLQICCKELLKVMKREGISKTHLSISHDRKLCIATVILE